MDAGSFLDGNGGVVLAVVGAILSVVISVVISAAVVVRLPPDHFVGPERRSKSLAIRIARNVGGVLLIALGVVLSFPGIPGQGILTILLGIMCLDLPGKRKAELWIVRRPSVRRTIDKLRRRYHREPLRIPSDAAVA